MMDTEKILYAVLGLVVALLIVCVTIGVTLNNDRRMCAWACGEGKMLKHQPTHGLGSQDLCECKS